MASASVDKREQEQIRRYNEPTPSRLSEEERKDVHDFFAEMYRKFENGTYKDLIMEGNSSDGWLTFGPLSDRKTAKAYEDELDEFLMALGDEENMSSSMVEGNIYDGKETNIVGETRKRVECREQQIMAMATVNKGVKRKFPELNNEDGNSDCPCHLQVQEETGRDNKAISKNLSEVDAKKDTHVFDEAIRKIEDGTYKEVTYEGNSIDGWLAFGDGMNWSHRSLKALEEKLEKYAMSLADGISDDEGRSDDGGQRQTSMAVGALGII